jgi:hypothetical protein
MPEPKTQMQGKVARRSSWRSGISRHRLSPPSKHDAPGARVVLTRLTLECWKPRSDRLGVSLEIEQSQVGFLIVYFD